MPRHLQQNPAAHRRGKGRKGQRRIERAERVGKTWASPLQMLQFAERCSAPSGSDTDFVMAVTMAYTGMRWSEALSLQPFCLRGDTLDIDWKLYELRARFYQGRPKDGSIRSADLPPFLADPLDRYLAATGAHVQLPESRAAMVRGGSYVSLGSGGGHFRRSNYSTRIVRPAADGWYPERKGPHPRATAPVLADLSQAWPGEVKSPWPSALPGEPYEPPTGRSHTIRLRADGLIGSHKIDAASCAGTEAPSRGADGVSIVAADMYRIDPARSPPWPPDLP